MKIIFTPSFKRKVQQLYKKNPQLISVFKKKLHLFVQDPLHPSLRLHKLKGVRSEQFAISLTGDLRALSIRSEKEDNLYIFFNIITHDEY